MRSILLLLTIVVTIALCLPALSAEDGGEGSNIDVRLSRVCPAYPGELISITNYGRTVDMNGWKLTDGEGSVTINSSYLLSTGSSVNWCESPERCSALYPDEPILWKNSTEVSLKGNLKLADKGDEVMLYDAIGALVDVLHYGTSEPNVPWNGPAATIKKGEMLVRVGESIGLSSWAIEMPGLFTLHTSPVSAKVTPILYPEGALEATVREIDRSQESIHLAVYLLENWTLARHLSMAEARGVNVTVLLEGQPVGGISENGAALAYYLQDAGADVWVMRSSDSFRRYDYLHAKYIVFDEEILLVSSENMADTSYGSNRGWGLLVESRSLSQDALDVFRRDMAGKGIDVFPLELSVARQEARASRMMVYDDGTVAASRASVLLATSPYGIEDTIVGMLDSAQERVLVQQLSIDDSWPDGSEIMDSLFRAAERGASVRILLDANIGTEDENEEVAEALNTKSAQKGWDLECRLMGDDSGFERIHNKGVIADSTVLVGSANWVNNSMQCNREMALLVSSEEVAGTFAAWFQNDWKGDSTPPTISLPWNYAEITEGTMLTLDATNCSDASGIVSFSWDLDGDGNEDLSGPLHTVTMPVGVHNITLTMTDALGNSANATMTVMVVEESGGALPLLLYAPIPALAILLLILRAKRRI
ncbi:MAG: phospholipase D-like domain-containing protein [Methanomassiliicoccales archaeon]|nr:phospholipase D-like domain-containing protein [Methanomassiliicoccales archaeon]